MDSKARSKPMRNILDRLLKSGVRESSLGSDVTGRTSFKIAERLERTPIPPAQGKTLSRDEGESDFEVIIFGDQIILEEPVEAWPLCDFLISFYSKGFPLEKAIEYVRLRRPFCVNDLQLATLLLDRRLVMGVLDAIDVPTPPRIVVNRDGGPRFFNAEIAEVASRDFSLVANSKKFPTLPLRLNRDELVVGEQSIRKPFVEKPVDAEDHNINLYFAGGGCRKLFRKVANKSSEFLPELSALRISVDSEYGRRKDSYIYEAFLQSDSCEDVKVYTVGLNYAHAETRK